MSGNSLCDGLDGERPDAHKIEPVEMIDMEKKAYAAKMAEYRKIFLK